MQIASDKPLGKNIFLCSDDEHMKKEYISSFFTSSRIFKTDQVPPTSQSAATNTIYYCAFP